MTLSPDPQRGGIEQVDTLIKSFKDKLGLRGWEVWHQDQICRYLDVHDGVRRTYGALITPGDVLADVQHALARLRADEVHSDPLGDLLARRATKELSAQRWVRLHEAGHPTNQKLNLSDVAVDLPARPRDGGLVGGELRADSRSAASTGFDATGSPPRASTSSPGAA